MGLMIPRDWGFACTLRDVAHIVWPGEPASLAALVQRLGIDHGEAHRALPDVRATIEVLVAADQVVKRRYRLVNETVEGIKQQQQQDESSRSKKTKKKKKKNNNNTVSYTHLTLPTILLV